MTHIHPSLAMSLKKPSSPEPLLLTNALSHQTAFLLFISKLNIHSSIIQNFLALARPTGPSLRCLPSGVYVLTVASQALDIVMFPLLSRFGGDHVCSLVSSGCVSLDLLSEPSCLATSFLGNFFKGPSGCL